MPDGGIYDQEAFIFGACAGAALYRRAMLEEIGFLDEDLFIFNEDVDLSFRAQLAKWKCVYVPNAVVQHRVSATMSQASQRSMYLIKRNNLWVILKDMPTELLWRYGALMLCYHFLSDLNIAMRGYAGAVLRGRVDALRGWKKIRSKRALVQRTRRASIAELEQALSHGLPSRVGH
jgi:GT2 family glycosyltransferase